jgi:hypothetical protein
MLIYISHPYSAGTLAELQYNAEASMDIALQLRKKGHSVFVPLLTHYLDRRWQDKGHVENYDYWLREDLRFLGCCDAILMAGNHRASRGCCREHEVAKAIGLVVYYDLQEIPAVISTNGGS